MKVADSHKRLVWAPTEWNMLRDILAGVSLGHPRDGSVTPSGTPPGLVAPTSPLHGQRVPLFLGDGTGEDTQRVPAGNLQKNLQVNIPVPVGLQHLISCTGGGISSCHKKRVNP